MSAVDRPGRGPAPYDLYVYRGDTLLETFRMRDRKTGAYLDLTGWSAAAKLRRTRRDVDPLLALSAEVSDPTKGEVVVSATPAETAAIDTSAAVWDLQLTEPDGTVRTWLAGEVEVAGDVTR